MSYGLTFYAASHDDLRAALLRPSGDFRARLGEVWKTVYDPDEGESYDAALETGLAGIRKALAAGGAALDLTGKLALVAAIEAAGEELGTLEHSSAAGEEFRRDFLEETAAPALGFPPLGEYLTNRPLFGFETREYPEWGFLRREELLKLPAAAETGDFPEWMTALTGLLDRAKAAGTDLLTVYR